MGRFLFPLVDRRQVAEGTMAFWFDTTSSRKFKHRPGQYVDITLRKPPYTDHEGNSRSFTIASSPTEKGKIMVTTRMRNTAFKNSLKEIPLGTKIIIQGPKGSFVLRKNSHRPAVFLAGGIGVTPFRSIIKYAVDKKLRHEIYLFYSNRTQKLAAFLEDLEGWQSEDRNFRLIPTATEEKGNGWKYEIGKIDEKMLRRYLGRDFSNGVYYVAGPPDMVSDMNQFLVKIGVNEASIESDGFDGY